MNNSVSDSMAKTCFRHKNVSFVLALYMYSSLHDVVSYNFILQVGYKFFCPSLLDNFK